MSRYIDANAIVDKVCEGISCNECSFGTNEDGMSECVLNKRIAELPIADVVEVVHGEWKQISPAKIYECSVCGQLLMSDDIDIYHFCHGCGAKMDGGTW